MYSQRPNIDLESMLNKAPTPNRLPALTHVQKVPARMIPNKQNTINQTNQWGVNHNFKDSKALEKRKTVEMGKRPLISPVRNPFKAQIQTIYGEQQGAQQFNKEQFFQEITNCVNHANKSAEFNIDIEDESLAYCGRCAAQLASQGFQVNKIQPSNVTRTIKKHESNNISQGQNLPQYPEYEENQMFQMMQKFLGELSEVESKHAENMTKFSEMDNHYSEQIEQTKHFYSELFNFVEQMKEDHLNDLYEESRKHSQLADIQNDYLRENVDQMANIRHDIEQNLEVIVEKLEEQDLRNNLTYYRQKIQKYRHQVEDQSEFFDSVINFAPQEYGSKLERVQDFLMEVWQSKGQTQQLQKQTDSYLTITQNNQYQYQYPKQNLNMQNTKKIPILKAPENDGQQPAFRKLFQEEEQAMTETSPQFKKI